MPPSHGPPPKQPWLYSLLRKIPGFKWNGESEMPTFTAEEVFSNRYRDPTVVSEGIKKLGFNSSEYELKV
ncbi:hypothetical protein IMZ48_38250 [Candidatus Bathyarchaeota archaeon]|nr:hypothetical protein [Candidatus Bathyarchaeota archaeon]